MPRTSDPPPVPVLPAAPDKAFYSLLEVAVITRRPLGMVRRWVYRGQLAAVAFDDGTICVPLAALRERLERPPRVERTLRRRPPPVPAFGTGAAADS